MKPETLDALLLDRAFGELTPEVGELLDAYVDSDPGRIARAERMLITVACARSALAAGPAEQPSLVRNTQSPWGTIVRRERAAEILRLAACVLFGGALGWGAFALHSPEGRASGRAVSSQVAATPSTPGRGASAFWAVDTARGEGTAGRRTPYRLRWESPVRMPRVEEEP